jgi:hypothetical protein
MDGYDGMAKPELQELARMRGLPVSGTKEEITARLRQQDAAQAEANEREHPEGLGEFENDLDGENPVVDPEVTEPIAEVPDDATAVPVNSEHDYEIGPDTSPDDPDPLADTPQETTGPAAPLTVGGEITPAPTRWREGNAPVVSGLSSFRRTYTVEGDHLGTEQHQALQRRVYDDAVEAGHRPRGGQYGGHRVGPVKNGQVTYEIHIRRG